MERKDLTPGRSVIHRKGYKYTIREIARHTETGEDFVIYASWADPLFTWARPIEMFLDGRFSLLNE